MTNAQIDINLKMKNLQAQIYLEKLSMFEVEYWITMVIL